MPQGQPVLRGEMQMHELGSGLILYAVRAQDLVEARSGNSLNPGIKATFLLSGDTELSYGGRAFHLDARRRGRRSAVLLSLAQTERFERFWECGRHEIKVSLTLTPEWIEACGATGGRCWEQLHRFSRQHLRELHWQPSLRVQSLAAQLFDGQAADPLLAGLRREGIALEIAHDVLQTLSNAPDDGPRPAPHVQARMRRLKDLLDSGEAQGMSLQQMATRLGSNAVDLQNHFRRCHGLTIFAYLRERRLGLAHERLLRNELTVDAAAQLAGYRSASAFSTAFKLRYGVSPSRLRRGPA